jgi:diguanylate cyclase (GGDEF)-like protein
MTGSRDGAGTPGKLLDPPDVHASPLFRDVPVSLAARVIAGSETRELHPGEVLLRQGAENDLLYVVLSGHVSVHLPDSDHPYVHLGPGECVGELSILDGQHVSADVIADEPAVVLGIEREMLWSLIDESPDGARNLLRMLAGRLRVADAAMSESTRQRRALERLATVDGLTGLRNRRWLDVAFSRQLTRAARTGQPMSVMMIDIDHFKQLNDRHGHAYGDTVLRRVAETLASGLRPQDLAARYGGEEFAVLLPGIELASAIGIAERLREAVQADGIAGGHGITVSIGVAGRSASQPLDALLQRADEALYRAKEAGRNRTAV